MPADKSLYKMRIDLIWKTTITASKYIKTNKQRTVPGAWQTAANEFYPTQVVGDILQCW